VLFWKLKIKKQKTVFITFQEIHKYSLHETKIPAMQVTPNETKVENIYKTWKEMPHCILTERTITIGVVKNNDEIEFYLLDGQHKLNAAYILYNNMSNNHKLKCTFVEIATSDEMQKLFLIINEDSKKIKYYVESDIFERKIICELKKEIEEKYKDCYRKKSKKDSYIMSSGEFLDKIVENKILKNLNDVIPECEYLINQLNEFHKIYFNDANYLELQDHPNAFYPEEQQIIKKYKNCMFFKNNNFVESFGIYLINNAINISHDYKKIRH
jgi:hypothetical protein